MRFCLKKTGDVFSKTVFKNTIGFVFLSTMGVAFADIADAFVLGHKLGENGLATVSFVIPIYMFYNVVAIGLASGCAITYAKLLGAGKMKEGVAHFNESLLFSLLLSVFTAVLGLCFLPEILTILGVDIAHTEVYAMTKQYASILLLAAPIFFMQALLLAFLRSDDGIKMASIAFIAGSIVDLLFSWFFVIVLDLGVTGAAVATVMGLLFTVALCLFYIGRKRAVLTFVKVLPSWSRIFHSFRIGMATSTQSVWGLVCFIVMNNLLMGLFGTHAVAVFDLTINISYIALAMFVAAGEVLRPMVSTFLGEKNRKAVKDTLAISLFFSVTIGFAIIVGLWFFAPSINTIFGISESVSHSYGILAVRIYLVSALMAGVNTILMDYFQVIEREKYAFIIGLLRGIVVIPFAFIGAFLFETNGVWVMYPLSEALTLTLALILLKRSHRAMEHADKDCKSDTFLIDFQKGSLAVALEGIESFLEEIEIPMKKRMAVVLMVEEIYNAIQTMGLKGQEGLMQVTVIKWLDEDFELHIRDNAPQLDLFSKTAQKITSEFEEEAIDSLPIILIQKNAKSHFYRNYQGFNTLSVLMEG